ncbi:alpha-galactosidase A precursor [Aspergillus saccharolyticus JOP 1030-1]|uniref:Alpha-galactosidase A n=1 Tax=Aspergillus saccharolyticus JOP 1030-1 TaxID=1450539 RepID=A0A319AK97_9EURO|nr:alpha-galactosidase A precursor [Aspergillus saccharolyticus JOP 1030-1]PYH47042.1 alpha-galactosidase A precursor [Aspergillus saccharolyticus JOP 1030-1]
MASRPTFEVLDCSVDEEEESYFRLLVDSKQIKYLTISPGTFKNAEMCFDPTLKTVLPRLPAGNWNDGTVTRDEDGRPTFTRINLTEFDGVENTWHETFVEWGEMELEKNLHITTYEVKCPRFEDIVVAKFESWHWYMYSMENETKVYQWLDGHGIGPRFLGHLTEHGRVIGFLIERISNARPAGTEDVEPCREALSQLHALGLLHGDINRHNFLIRDGKATLIDFSTTRKCDDEDMFREEMEALPDCLADTWNNGGKVELEPFHGTYGEMTDPDRL